LGVAAGRHDSNDLWLGLQRHVSRSSCASAMRRACSVYCTTHPSQHPQQGCGLVSRNLWHTSPQNQEAVLVVENDAFDQIVCVSRTRQCGNGWFDSTRLFSFAFFSLMPRAGVSTDYSPLDSCLSQGHALGSYLLQIYLLQRIRLTRRAADAVCDV
jgi:hypothetical protein